MDPWQPCPVNSDSDGNVTNVVGLALHNQEKSHGHDQIPQITSPNSRQLLEQSSGSDLSFNDNFKPFVKLPDSHEYLASLEKKLKVIQKGGPKGPNADSILSSLGQTKESCMIKLLSNSVEQLTADEEFFEELKVNPLLKKLAPEKQALSAEELVHLLKADQLEIILNNNNHDEELASGSTESEAEIAEVSKELSGETEKDKDSTENLASAGVL